MGVSYELGTWAPGETSKCDENAQGKRQYVFGREDPPSEFYRFSADNNGSFERNDRHDVQRAVDAAHVTLDPFLVRG